MIAIPLPQKATKWTTLSFASTLYLCPILDLLLVNIPSELKAEIRLGLQEALVNAAKHGNALDPSKQVIVKFTVEEDQYSWVILDQGDGFTPECQCSHITPELPPEESESGRGLCILHQIFDTVHWNAKGTQLRLAKRLKKI
ncbi:MAG: anti-sigma regulatory factor [Cyanobacteria bacterium J083]|nr:MAG: anti-sigma regulatory factor [Cyanobacteria bacterium J083]